MDEDDSQASFALDEEGWAQLRRVGWFSKTGGSCQMMRARIKIWSSD